MKKYEFTGKFIEIRGIKLFQIRALVSFGAVFEGDVGGYIESEDNLSHEGNAWVSSDADVLSVINLIGVCEFPVTAYCDFVQIGCKLHKIDVWDKIFKKRKYITECRSEDEYEKCKKAFKYCKKLLKSNS